MPLFTIGVSSNTCLFVDLDSASFRKALGIATMLAREYPSLGNVLLRRSSRATGGLLLLHDTTTWSVKLVMKREGWHLVFGGRIKPEGMLHITDVLETLDIIGNGSYEIRVRRGDNTLRLTDGDPCLAEDSKLDDEALIVVFRGEAWAYEAIDEYISLNYAVRGKPLAIRYLHLFPVSKEG